MNRDDALAALKFSSPVQHSLALLDEMSQALTRDSFELHEVMTLAIQLTYNAQAAARPFVQALKTKISHPDAHKRFDHLLKICDYTDRLATLPAIRRDPDLVRRLYALEGYVYSEARATSRRRLAVVFTTMFNNFGVANAVLLAILQTYDVSVLLLKDCSRANYLGGASGFGDNLDEVAQLIDAFAREHAFDDIYLLGYSSGGYASCYVSTRIRCAAHLGLSFPADFSPDTTLPTDWFIARELRERFDRRYLHDLSRLMPAATGRQRVIVGAKSSRDLSHARHLGKAGGIEIVELANCTHDTPTTLIATGDIEPQLDWLFGSGA